jgi:hypothetical protein
MDGITSRHKLQDVSISTWFIFLAMVHSRGFPYLWICAANLLCAGILQRVLSAKTPRDSDRSVGRSIDPDTRGFPSLESHMAVVVIVPAIELLASHRLVQIALSLWIFLVGFSRIYVRSRFPSQVLCSWVTGLAGLAVGTQGHLHLQQRTLPPGLHHVVLVVTGMLIVLVIGYAVENNTSRLAGVPRGEFKRVFRDMFSHHRVQTDEGEALLKRDSFGALQESLAKRRLSQHKSQDVTRPSTRVSSRR